MGATQYTVFLAASFIVSIITGVMGIVAFSIKARGARWFGVLMCMIALWCFAIAGQMLSTNEFMSNQWSIAMVFAVAMVPPFYMLFVYYFTGREKELRWWKIPLLFLNPVVAFTLFAIPATQYLMMTEFYYERIAGYLVVVGYDIGLYYPVHLASTILTALIADVMILQHAFQWPKTLRKKLYILILATLIPIATNLIQTARIFPNLHGNLDVFGFSIAGIIIGIVFYMDKLLALQPVAGRQLMRELPDALLVFDKDWKLVEGNPAAQSLFGEPFQKRIEEHLPFLIQNKEIEEHKTLRNSFVLQNKDEVQHFDVIVSPLLMGPQLMGYQMLLRDVTELIQSMEKLEQLATTDPLTGLNNRRFYHLEGERIYDLAQRYQHSICVMTFDIDHFKQINDRYGHHSGDEVLVQVAELIKVTSRKSDIVARFGGDEFFVLLPESTNGYAVALAKRLQARLKENPFEIDGNQVSITFSFGIASCEPGKNNALSLDALMREADLQLYEAKHQGRDQICMVSF